MKVWYDIKCNPSIVPEKMATVNKSVAVYLPPDVEAALRAYCFEKKITRDNGKIPVLGTGIICCLKELLIEPAHEIIPSTIPNAIPGEIRSIIAKEIDRIENDLEENVLFLKTDHVHKGEFHLVVGEIEEALAALDAKVEANSDEEGGMMTQQDWWLEKFDDLRGQLRMVIEDFDHRLRELEFKVPIGPHPSQVAQPKGKKKGFG